MSKKKIKLEEIGNANPFQVPEGYFDGFAENLMSRLPDRVNDEPKTISLWTRVRPWVYMAAMFAGIALMIKLFVGSPELVSRNSSTLNLTSSAEIEDFFDYYENQYVNSYYNETFYLALEDVDWTEE
jgi:hypothetical protein